ncbi:MAG: restriction endonuclease subunit S [Burkholderiales bacterium]|nr:restriction endonuclease subunit S [Burkholderiales bacterium]
MSSVLEPQARSAQYLELLHPALMQQAGLLAIAQGSVGRLRDLILELAIRGRLVPQDLDGADRTSTPTVADDGPFDLPKGWSWKHLNALQPEFQNGAASRGDVGGEPTTVLRLADIKDRRVSLADTRQVPIHRRDIEKYRLRDGDILITRVNGSADIVGQFNLVEGDPEAIYCDHFIRMRANRAVVDPKYLALFGESEVIRGRIKTLFISTAGQKTVNQSHVGSLPIAIPSLGEQARIVARVDELMRLCDGLEANGRIEAEQHARLLGTLLDTLTDSTTHEELAANWQRVAAHFDLLLDRPEAVDALEQTIMHLAIRGLLVPQDSLDPPVHFVTPSEPSHGSRMTRSRLRTVEVDDEVLFDEPFAIPISWLWTKFSKVARVASNLVPPLAHLDAWQVAPDCIEKRTGRLLSRRTVREAGVFSSNHRFLAGQILYSKIRPSLSKVVRIDFDGLCSADMYPISAHINADYLLLYMLSDHFLKQVAIAENRVKMPKLNQEALTGFVVAVPPLAEQARIVARVTELRRLCADLRKRLVEQQTVHSHLADALVEQALA